MWLGGLGVSATVLSLLVLLSATEKASLDFKDQFGICRGGNHVVGQWAFNERLTDDSKSFYCCGYDEDDYLSNTTLCGALNAKEHQDVPIGPRPHREYSHYEYFVGKQDGMMQSGGRACLCDAVTPTDRWKVHHREKYEWVPSFCFLRPWNAKAFCDLLGDRNILIRGDSSAGQSAITLINMLSAKGEKCQTQITFSWANLLALPSNPANFRLIDMVRKTNASIVIFSAGAHFFELSKYAHAWEPMPQRIAEVLSEFPHVKFAFKTINPGHVDCRQHANPIDHYVPPRDAGNDEYKWNLHPAFDNYAKEFVRTKLNIPIIDMSPLYTRPDAHSDCLHFCLPGPLDIFSVLLMNMLETGEL
jgi:hypothetical protein